ncbi:hypothetical protein DRQ26_03820 [bacterium]|nr:MAG: hypothetical protein DRQ26_03820 [bacterium]
MEYQNFLKLFLEAEKLRNKNPERAVDIYRSLVEDSLELIKSCYIGDKNYHANYKLVDEGVDKKIILDYKEEWIEAISALSNYALERLEKKIISAKGKQTEHPILQFQE